MLEETPSTAWTEENKQESLILSGREQILHGYEY